MRARAFLSLGEGRAENPAFDAFGNAAHRGVDRGAPVGRYRPDLFVLLSK
jgi:hypothetical protein